MRTKHTGERRVTQNEKIPAAHGLRAERPIMAYTSSSFTVRSCVVNFDVFGVVVEVRDDGLLVLDNPRIGRWVADPAQCTLYHLQLGDLD